MSENPKGHCLVDGCGAVIELKTNRAGKLYYSCRGDADPQFNACGSVMTFGKVATANLLAKMEKAKPNETDSGPKEPATGQPTGNGKSDSDGYFG